MKLKIGKRELEMGGKYLGTGLRDCNAILHDQAALHRQMAEDGYLLIRGLHKRETVWRARRTVIDHLAEGGFLAEGTDPDLGIVGSAQGHPATLGRKSICQTPEMRSVIEGKPIFDFFQHFLGTQPMTYDYKWLRAVRPGGFTGAHYDVVYMGRGTVGKLFTVWTPLDDIPYEKGGLVLCVGSHNLPGFQKVRDSYGKMDVDRDRVQGWFSDDPEEVVEKFGGKWQTTQYQAGDVIIFGMHTMHMSVNNQTNQWRISCDTRFQPANEPVDERWIGENPIAHYAWNAEPEKNMKMETARANWGI
jgi:hypothetical protein